MEPMSRALLPLVSLALLPLGCFDPDTPALPTEDTGTGPFTTGTQETEGADPGLSCSDGILNGDETDVDCGGGCDVCGDGQGCGGAEDCASMLCVNNVCQAPSCTDGLTNGDESDVDCGGSCDPCGDGGGCNVPEDCASGVCMAGTCQAPGCGDGVVNGDTEVCDGGGESSDCNADCTPAACGDGIINMAAGETCDELEQTDVCDADCTMAECGDGVLNRLAGELCDDGGPSPACDADCTEVACGDGEANRAAGEECDGAGETAACDIDCTLATCGDSQLNPTAGEACDDGDMIDDNVCSNACQLNACTFDVGLLPILVHPANHFGELDFDGSCNLVVAGAFEDAVYRISPMGVVTPQGTFGAPSAINGIAYRSSDDTVYVSTNGPSELWSLTPAGVDGVVMSMPASINAIEIAPPGFGAFEDLVIAAGSNGSIYALDPMLASSTEIGSAGSNISDLVFDPTTATLYLASYGSQEVLTMDAMGNTAVFAGALGSVDGMALDPAGTLFAGSSGPSQVTAIDLATGAQNVIGTPQFDGGTYVSGLLFEASGNVLVKASGANIDYVTP